MVDPASVVREGSLADFLRSKRERLTPQDVGLPGGRRRRTPGLRREELADLAGVGVSWYTALEQGRDINPSDHLLSGLAEALRLTSAEAQHLFFLAGRHPPVGLMASSSSISLAHRQLIEILSPRPALIANQRWDWLAWNDAADLFFEFDSDSSDPSPVRNMLWETFKGKRLMPDADWEAYARLLVGRLRASPHFSTNNAWFENLVQQLMNESEDFKRIWNRYEVADVSQTTSFVHHSKLGRVSVEVLTFLIPTAIDTWLVVFLVDDGVIEYLLPSLASRRQRRNDRSVVSIKSVETITSRKPGIA